MAKPTKSTIINANYIAERGRKGDVATALLRLLKKAGKKGPVSKGDEVEK